MAIVAVGDNLVVLRNVAVLDGSSTVIGFSVVVEGDFTIVVVEENSSVVFVAGDFAVAVECVIVVLVGTAVNGLVCEVVRIIEVIVGTTWPGAVCGLHGTLYPRGPEL